MEMRVFTILVAVFVAIPIIEFALLIEVGQRLGTVNTLILIFGTGTLGAYLARLEGFRVLDRIRRDMAVGIPPADQLVDGVLVLIAGVLLITPGLLTDIAGFTLLVPITRFPIKTLIRNWIRNRIHTRIHIST